MDSIEDAIRFYYRGEIFEAESILRVILDKDPENVNALVRLAAIQKDLGRFEEAGEIYLKAAEIYEREGHYEDCLNILEKASSLIKEAAAAPLAGRCLFRLGRYNEALSKFIISPEDDRILFYTGRTYFYLNQFGNALSVFQKVLNRASGKEEIFQAYYWIGKCLCALGRFDEAVSCFNRYISFYPGEKQAYLDLAVCCLNSGQLEKARSSLMQYSRLGGVEPEVFFYLGVINYHMGNYWEVIALLDRLKEHDQALHWKGLAYYELGMYEEALQCFTSAAKYESKPLYLKMMGNAYLKLRNYFEAKLCYEKALSLDPSDRDLEKLVYFTKRLLK